MAGRNYAYQYETSPRKLKPEYTRPAKKVQKKKSTARKTTAKKVDKAVIKKKEPVKAKVQSDGKVKVIVFGKAVLLFAIIFLLLFRNAQITGAFSEIQSLKAAKTTIQKENDQLEISIQNSINLNNIEQAAKSLLGMQKLSSKQTVYINLPKKDYVEQRTEEVIIDEESSFFEMIKGKLMNIF
ncbi:MAG: cell division protein FtsL [Clostridia bacterium]|nr:cell division protein FtsL [Clostridia bacterium]